MSDKNFDGIDALVEDIKAKYLNAEFGKYRVVSVVKEESIWERLTTRKKKELVYLILEEIDG